MSDEKPAAAPEAEGGDSDIARIRANAEKYGSAYAAFGEAFQTQGMTALTRYVSWFIAASAVGVIVLAILSKF